MQGDGGVTDQPPTAEPLSIWRNPDFLLLWSGRSVSALGSSVSSIAFPFLILALTNSPALAGIGAALGTLSSVLLGLPAGALADRWDKKRTMVLCEAGRALTLGSIPIALWTGHLSLLHLYMANVIEGTLRVFYGRANILARTTVVPPEQFAATWAQDEATYYAAGLIGPAVGGALYQIGRGLPFLIDAISYLVSALSLLFKRANLGPKRVEQTRRLGAEVREGLAWVWQSPLIRSLSLLDAGQTLAASGLGLLVIVVAKQQHASPGTIGLIFSISAIGGILGSLLGGQVQKLLTFGQTMMTVMWALTGLWLLYTVAHGALMLGLVTAGIYFLNPAKNVALVSYALPRIPEEIRGQVLGVWDFIPDTMALAGPPLMGFALQFAGVTPTAIGASAVVLLTALFATLNPAIRNAPRGSQMHAAGRT